MGIWLKVVEIGNFDVTDLSARFLAAKEFSAASEYHTALEVQTRPVSAGHVFGGRMIFKRSGDDANVL